MFKCLDISINEPVVSLDDRGPAWIQELRQKSHNDHLRCPTCREAVTFRVGTLRRPHFAHKTLANCPTKSESPELLEARAVLYEWLKLKFDNVSIEQFVDGAATPRAFDCWVEYKGKRFAYWLVDKRIVWKDKEAIENAAKQADASLTWVFLHKTLRRVENNPKLIMLPTTERCCARFSDYDQNYGHCRGTLHYLDVDNQTFVTFRGCHCEHPPQVYSGCEIITALPDLHVSQSTGEFVHPGEYEALSRLQEEKQRQHGLEREQWQKTEESQSLGPRARMRHFYKI
jgi:hypothetical protein